MGEPRVQVKKSSERVYLEIAGVEASLSPFTAREVGEALYKTGCDVQAKIDAANDEPRNKRGKP